MKVIMHTRPDGGMTRYSLNQGLLGVMMGQGYNWDDSRVAWEISKFMFPPEPEVGLSEASAHHYIFALAYGGLTETEAIECFQMRLEHKPRTIETILEDDTLPSWMQCGATAKERYENFRDAAEWDGTTCQCNMEKARVIHMQRIREVRNTELVNLDIPFIRAVEVKDAVEQGRIAGLKQVLRDIPQTFSLSTCRNASTLNAAWPVELPSRDA
jgi:hypothetical protein